MVSHNSTFAVISGAASPTLSALPPAGAPPRAPPLGGGVSKPGHLDGLFKLGAQRFAAGRADFDADTFADTYCRILQSALRGNAVRSRRIQRELDETREQNKRMRAQLAAAVAAEKTGNEAKPSNNAGKMQQKPPQGRMRKCAADARKDDPGAAGAFAGAAL